MSELEREHRFTPTILLIAGSLLVWMTNFVLVYVFAALACARGFEGYRLVGLPIVPLVTTLSSIGAGAITAMLLRRGWLLVGSAPNEHARFIGFVALATSALSLIALVLLAIPALLTVACHR